MRKTGTASSHPGFLDSLIVLFVATGLALFLLWAASRIEGATAFEQLPDWLRSSYSAIWGLILSGTGLGLAIVKALTRKGQPAPFNYLVAILVTTLALLVVIFVLTHLFKQRQQEKVADSPGKAAAPPPYQPALHTEAKDGAPYVVTWEMDPACRTPIADKDHRCEFRRTQATFSGDNTPFDHWDVGLKAPGAVYKVDCQPTGSNEFNEVKGDYRGSFNGPWAECTGWINGGDFPIKVTAYYKMLW